jgi:acylphosphatase
MNAASFLIEGRVQGVGFRAGTARVARGYDVTGWVRNEPDGSVAVHAEGEREEVEAFLQGLRDSDLGGHIRAVRCEWVEPAGCRGFSIRP